MPLIKRCLAEFLGTLWLVLGGCGAAVFAASFPYTDAAKELKDLNTLGLGFFGVSLAFGLTVLTMAYAIGHISGCHLNPAVSFGLWASKRFPGSDLLPYIISQVIGATVAGGLIYLIATNRAIPLVLGGGNPLATNGFGPHSPGGYNLLACFITEVVMTFFFLMIILGSTDRRVPVGFAPVPIGLGLTLIHLISIPITNTSVNPARSTGVAIFAGAELFAQVWLFWLAPILGALIAGFVYHQVFDAPETQTALTDDYNTSI